MHNIFKIWGVKEEVQVEGLKVKLYVLIFAYQLTMFGLQSTQN